MRVLVACEFSGIVRDAFIAKGHDAVSCDLLPTERPGPHIQGDVNQQLGYLWDLIIAHPPCTRLCNSGARWLRERDLWEEMIEAAVFYRRLLKAGPCKRRCIENPIMHRYAKKIIDCPYVPIQTVQPWQFGHGETKATCLQLRGLNRLKPTDIVEGREAKIHKMPPSKDRGKLRSITYQGIADAMAEQWGGPNA